MAWRITWAMFVAVLCSVRPAMALAAPPPVALPQATDLTNKQADFAKFVDANSHAEESFWFSIQAACRLTVTVAPETGFKVVYRVRTLEGSDVLKSLMGTNHHTTDVMLGPGSYQFIMIATRDAGYYTYGLETHCQ